MSVPIFSSTGRTAACITLALTAGVLLSSPVASNAADRGVARRGPHAKHVHSKLTVADERGAIDVKFAEGSDLRLCRGRLVPERTGRIVALDAALARFRGLRVSRLFASTTEPRLDAARRQARARSDRRQADMNLYFRIQTRSAADTVALLDALNALDIVEVATPVAKPTPPPATPSFVAARATGTRRPAAGSTPSSPIRSPAARASTPGSSTSSTAGTACTRTCQRRATPRSPMARVRPVRCGGRRHRPRHRCARRARR